MRTVLSIAGFDPSSGAGITADLAVFAAHGMFGTSCITALTVQNTLGVAAVHAVDPSIVRHTLQHLHVDLPPTGIKIGMLANAQLVAVVAEFLESHPVRPIVVLDPVLRSTSGKDLLDREGIQFLRERLIPLVDWVTPNESELDLLGGLQALQKTGVVVTGGDREPPDDLLVFNHEEIWLRGTRIETTATHGTGCAFSSSLLCRLVAGEKGPEAAQGAKSYVAEAMRRASRIGHGRGPMNHLWPLR